jgi:hypothetical protein
MALADGVVGLAQAATSAVVVQAQGGKPDILTMALITMGAILGAAALGVLLYLLRLRIGFWMHRPPPASPGEQSGH